MAEVFDYLDITKDKSNSSTLDDILSDNGIGNVSRGLVLLELVSSAKRRKNDFMLRCLNVPACVKLDLVNKPLTEISEQEKFQFIAKVLKCNKLADLLKYYNNDKYLLFERLFIDLFDKVHTGAFFRKEYRYLIPYLKRTVYFVKNESKQSEKVKEQIG